MAQVTKIEETTIEQVEEALVHFTKSSMALEKGQRQVGNDTWTSPWDVIHASIDELLDRWETLQLEAMAAV